jgi:hypothetical protein
MVPDQKSKEAGKLHNVVFGQKTSNQLGTMSECVMNLLTSHKFGPFASHCVMRITQNFINII